MQLTQNNISYEVIRTVNTMVEGLLDDFLVAYRQRGLDPLTSVAYYNFMLASYGMTRENRYSLSMLAQVFNENKLPTNLLLNIYAHTLYCLAMYDGKKIYEEFVL